jgi:hypothetical protein
MTDRMRVCYPDWYLELYGPEDQFAQNQPDEYSFTDDFDDEEVSEDSEAYDRHCVETDEY